MMGVSTASGQRRNLTRIPELHTALKRTVTRTHRPLPAAGGKGGGEAAVAAAARPQRPRGAYSRHPPPPAALYGDVARAGRPRSRGRCCGAGPGSGLRAPRPSLPLGRGAAPRRAAVPQPGGGCRVSRGRGACGAASPSAPERWEGAAGGGRGERRACGFTPGLKEGRLRAVRARR